MPVVLPSDTASPTVELRDESPRRTRRAQRRIRPVRVMAGSISDLPMLMLQDRPDAQGAVVYNCRPPLLPVSLQLGDLGTFARMRPDMVLFPELGVTPLIDSGTDLEDEMPTPDDSPGSVAVSAAGAVVPQVFPAARGGFDLELAKALLDVSVVPMMITPIVDPVVDSMVSPAAYPEPPLPVVLVDVPVPVAESSPWQGVADSPVRECSPLFHASPVGSGYGPIPSPMSPSSQITDGHGPPLRMATMDQYLPRMGTPFGGGGGSSELLRSRVPLRVC